MSPSEITAKADRSMRTLEREIERKKYTEEESSEGGSDEDDF